MSTPAIIAVKIDNQLHAVYCHNDGYLHSVGRCLLENYNTQEAAESLVALGDLSSVHPRLAPAPGEAHSFDHPAPGVTVAYHRDRGEDLNPWAPFALATGVSVSDIVENLDDSGYVYVFMDDAWYYRDEDGRLVPLTKENTRAPRGTQEGQEDTQEPKEGSQTNYKELVEDIRGFLSNYKKIRYGELVGAPWPYNREGPLVYEEPVAALLDQAADAITELLGLCKSAEAWAESAEKERDDALETMKNAIITGKAEIFKDYRDQLEDCMARALKIFARPGDPNGFCGLTQEFWVEVLGAAQNAGLCAVSPGFGEAYRQACERKRGSV